MTFFAAGPQETLRIYHEEEHTCLKGDSSMSAEEGKQWEDDANVVWFALWGCLSAQSNGCGVSVSFDPGDCIPPRS